MIPRILHRSVPMLTSTEVELWWTHACDLHPGWELRTWRDPLDAADWPETAPHWDRCSTGAQFAGLIRLEALWREGGIYLDSDVELFRSLDLLTAVPAFAAWEDVAVIPDAVLGAEPGHPAIGACLDLAIERLDEGAHRSGPGVTTEVLAARPDVLVLPPGAFYPYHYTEPNRRSPDLAKAAPWAFAAHHWHASWVPPRRGGRRR